MLEEHQVHMTRMEQMFSLSVLPWQRDSDYPQHIQRGVCVHERAVGLQREGALMEES